jgi:hypothetical protein
VAAEEEEAFAAAVVASIAAAAVASMAGVAITAEAMATMAHQSSWVRAAGGMFTASASAGGDLGSIAVTLRAIGDEFGRVGKTGAPFSFD